MGYIPIYLVGSLEERIMGFRNHLLFLFRCFLGHEFGAYGP